MPETRLADNALDQIFRKARTHNGWTDRQVSDELLRELYELMKWGPTSANLAPARIFFLRTKQAKERLKPALMAGNVEKMMAAPVTAIIAHDENFYEKAPQLFPHMPAIRDMFAASAELTQATAFRNGTLQGGYLILAARALGLDTGPMSGFDNAKVDAEFFPDYAAAFGLGKDNKAGCRVRSNFLCNLGYGRPDALFPRLPRLSFDEACRLM